jgi:hypothetical protein
LNIVDANQFDIDLFRNLNSPDDLEN